MHHKLGTVVIGLNEGGLLRRCFESIIPSCEQLVYVDSNSSDNSVFIASSMGIEVVELDLSKPFTAARARNEGYSRLLELFPGMEFVFFVDGDCEVSSVWIEQASEELNERPNVAVVCGRLREKRPEQSIYNRICDLEWDTPVGSAMSCGGISVMRVQAYQAVGGFDLSVLAGEEPELCYRFRKAGWQILRIDSDMALHDAAITQFSQWWQREVRTGYGGLDVQLRFGLQDFSSINNSARLWSIGFLLVILVAAGLGWLLVDTIFAFKAVSVVLMILPVQALRIATKGMRRGLSIKDACLYGCLMILSKWPQIIGQLRRYREGKSKLGKENKVIEQKEGGATGSFWQADLKCYSIRPWLSEQSIWSIAVYRFGRRIDLYPYGLRKKGATFFYWRIFRLVETITGISLPKEAEVGPGLRIYHFGNIFIHPNVQIGANCTLRQGVTIGNRKSGGPVPVIGGNVEIGAYAQILGDVKIGDDVKIGAMSVVLNDVPSGATAVGNPARIIKAQSSSQE